MNIKLKAALLTFRFLMFLVLLVALIGLGMNFFGEVPTIIALGVAMISWLTYEVYQSYTFMLNHKDKKNLL